MVGYQRRADAFKESMRHDCFGVRGRRTGLGWCRRANRAFRDPPQQRRPAPRKARASRGSRGSEAAIGGAAGPRLPDARYPVAGTRCGDAGTHERVSTWISEIVGAASKPVVIGGRAGNNDRRAESGPADPVKRIVDQMARRSFGATVALQGDAAEITLHTYAFASTTVADPATVCVCDIVDRPRARSGDRRAGGRRPCAYRSCGTRRLRCRVESDTPAGTAP